MKITALMENTTCKDEFRTEHGLSFYIEAKEKKVLFDTGLSGSFIENAQAMGIDLQIIDFAILSRGHYDHGGGLNAFLEFNSLSPIFARKMAFDPHYSQRPDELFYNGLDRHLLPNDRFIFTDHICVIDDTFSLFSEVPHYEPLFSSNKAQLEIIDGEKVPDRFMHEQNLVINEDGKYTLIAGCSHSGIYNIILRFQELYNCAPDVVFGGFHLMEPSLGKSIPDSEIDGLAMKLLTLPSKYYTCHCTGQYAYNRLKQTMGDKIDYISTGDTIQY